LILAYQKQKEQNSDRVLKFLVDTCKYEAPKIEDSVPVLMDVKEEDLAISSEAIIDPVESPEDRALREAMEREEKEEQIRSLAV
jgi:hypothetical protein